MRLLIILAAGVVSCGPGSGPVPEQDAAPDGGEDAGPDADGSVDADPDVPPPDGDAPSCDTPEAETELTPSPAIVSSPRLAVGPDGYALAWLADEEPHDVMAVVLDDDFVPLAAPVTLAMVRPQATEPDVIWFHGDWLVAWADGNEDVTCTDSDCDVTMQVARVGAAGEIMTPARALWSDQPTIGGPRIVETPDGAVFAATVERSGTPRVCLGRVDGDTRAIGGLGELIGDRTARRNPPAATLLGTDRVVVVAAVVAGGLMAASVDTADLVPVIAPIEIVHDISASSPTVDTSDSLVGVTYLTGDASSVAISLVELTDALEAAAPPVVVSEGAHWPRSPQIGAAPPGWVVVWYDGRNDSAADCVTSHFCRNDVFLQAASRAGAHGDALRLSADPNDCTSPSVGVRDGLVAAAWRTARDGRWTAFARQLRCD